MIRAERERDTITYLGLSEADLERLRSVGALGVNVDRRRVVLLHGETVAEVVELVTAVDGAVSGYICPRCTAESAHPEDGRNGYCGRCHDFTGDPRPSPAPTRKD